MALEGCNISLNGPFEDATHESIIHQIQINNGRYSENLTNTCTHLICNSNNFDPNIAKVQQAATIPGLKIVEFSWLLDSIEGQQKKGEKDYQINLNKKRARSPPPVPSEKTPNKDRGEERPPGKRIRTEAQPPAVAKAEETEEPPNEKPNDSQIAEDRAIRVSVGEEFAACGNEVEEAEERRGDKPKDSQKVDEEFGARSNEIEQTGEPRDVKPNDAQKAKYRALCVPDEEEPAARGNEVEDMEESLGRNPKSAQEDGRGLAVRSSRMRPPGEGMKDAVSANDEFAGRSIEVEETEEPRVDKLNDDQETKGVDLFFDAEEELVARSDEVEDKEEPLDEMPKEAQEVDEELDETEEPQDENPRDAQKSKSRAFHVPVDEEFAARNNGNYTVYIGEDGTIWDASLNQTVTGQNKNKFYLIQVLQIGSLYTTLTRWGRVGEAGQQDTLPNGDLDSAIRFFEMKFKKKSGLTWANRLDPPRSSKYTFIERNYEESDDEIDEKRTEKLLKTPESKLAKPVQSLMELIFNKQYFAASLDQMSYDARKLPLGKLSERTLMMGYEKLKALADLIGDPSAPRGQTTLAKLSDSYYSLIPHVFGHNRPPVIDSGDRMRKEIALLESLSDMEIANELMKESKYATGEAIHPLDQKYSRLGMQEMTPLDIESTEFKLLNHYLQGSSGQTHNFQYKVQDIFRIERNGETERFEKSLFAKREGDRRLLWHGSRCTNYGSILSQGLRIAPPEAPASGYMFGKGVYLADASSKSANYCYSYLSGNTGLLLLCEVEVGKPMLELTNASSNAAQEAQEKGCVATWGKGKIGPVGWKDAGCVHPNLKGVSMPDVRSSFVNTNVANTSLNYNEYIVYDVAQIKLRYLLRVEIK